MNTDARVDLLAPPDDAAVDRALAQFSDAVALRFGRRLRGIYLFGSRARGDFEPFSDIDVAIVLEDPGEQSLEKLALLGLAYDIFLQTGAEIQPWIFEEGEWTSPDRSADARLIRSAKRDSRVVGRP